MRYSKQREEILRLISCTSCHPTADWIYKEVRKNIPNISMGTIYRNLKQLVENNLIQAETIDGIVHYDANIEKHYHFYCTKCKNVVDVEIPIEQFITNIKRDIDHIIQGYNFQLRGICRKCQLNKQ